MKTLIASMLLFATVILALGCAQETTQPVQTPQPAIPTEQPPSLEVPVPGSDVPEQIVEGEETAPEGSAPVTFVITGENFKFVMNGQDNPDIKVKVGDTVRIEFSAAEGFHDWVVDEFSARTEQVRPGTPTSVEFVADKAGTFSYYCSVGEHRALGMEGNLIVE